MYVKIYYNNVVMISLLLLLLTLSSNHSQVIGHHTTFGLSTMYIKFCCAGFVLLYLLSLMFSSDFLQFIVIVTFGNIEHRISRNKTYPILCQHHCGCSLVATIGN